MISEQIKILVTRYGSKTVKSLQFKQKNIDKLFNRDENI